VDELTIEELGYLWRGLIMFKYGEIDFYDELIKNPKIDRQLADETLYNKIRVIGELFKKLEDSADILNAKLT